MRPTEAHRILTDAHAEDLARYLVLDSVRGETYEVHRATAYLLGNDYVEIVWDRDGNVFKKRRTGVRPTWAARVLAWLAAVGL
jgi:hypothetical protein